MQTTQEASYRIIRRKRAAQYLGVSVTTIDRLVAAGDLPPPIRISKQARGFRESDLISFVERRAVAP